MSGMGQYIHLIRAPGDPARQKRASERDAKDVRGSDAWRKLFRKASKAEWMHAIRKHLGDGEARTFNRIMVEIVDMTADIAAGKAPDDAIWALVAEGWIEHTLVAPIYFRALPPCVIGMKCYCAGHARGNPPSASCDATEQP